MKKITLILLLLLLIPIVNSEDSFNAEKLQVRVKISSNIDTIPTSNDWVLKWIKANLILFPINTKQQKVLSLSTEPESELVNNTLKFEWQEPKEKSLSFKVDSKIEIENKPIKVKNKIKFPIEKIDDELIKYTKPSETVDSNNKEIVALASSLAEGEDDLYVVVYKLADWTNKNIEYNLSTLTADISQKASWVLSNREGVCDELTSLFIAMSRAVGIPARFVSGISYTNSPIFEKNWVPHSWAEVWFPDYGWIPFDPTYGEYGWVDPTHILLDASVDAKEKSVHYEWRGRNVELNATKLDIKTLLEKKTGKINPFISIDAKLLKKEVLFGSYNLIEAEIQNLKDYYVAAEIDIAGVNGLELLSYKRNVLLKPKEKKKIYYIVKVNKDLDPNYRYVFPVTIYSTRNVSATSHFNATKDGFFYSLDDIESVIQEHKKEKRYSRSLSMNCSAKKQWSVNETAIANCVIKNTGNTMLKDLSICMEKCIKIDLGISQEKRLNLTKKLIKPGKQILTIKASNEDVSKTVNLETEVLEIPKIKLNLNYSETVNFKDAFSISFTLNKVSSSNPLNVKTELTNSYKKEWFIEELENDKKFVINLKGTSLKEGKNDFEIKVYYEDIGNKQYIIEEKFSITLNKLTLIQKIRFFFMHLFKKSTNY